MKDPATTAASHPDASTSPTTDDATALEVDFGGGCRKAFSAVPHHGDMAVTDVLDAARWIGPGLAYRFASTFVDRGGREVGVIWEVDGVAAGEGRAWRVSVNGAPVTDLRHVTLHSVTRSGEPRVRAGDTVALALVPDDGSRPGPTDPELHAHQEE